MFLRMIVIAVHDHIPVGRDRASGRLNGGGTGTHFFVGRAGPQRKRGIPEGSISIFTPARTNKSVMNSPGSGWPLSSSRAMSRPRSGLRVTAFECRQPFGARHDAIRTVGVDELPRELVEGASGRGLRHQREYRATGVVGAPLAAFAGAFDAVSFCEPDAVLDGSIQGNARIVFGSASATARKASNSAPPSVIQESRAYSYPMV